MKRNKGQAVVEYILLIVMIAVTVAVAIRNINFEIYQIWSGLARSVARPCPRCTVPPAPKL
ncbi:MAG: hypothetical protein EBR01_06560 [Proteobacteria bacterium]|nr:hypothetical protein [Pseudomonadota bacterium]NBY19056.1 hypothetical protein [bacterium]